MVWLRRYFELFENQSIWWIVVASVIITGVILILEKFIKISVWVLIVVLVASFVMVMGSMVLFL